MWETENFKIYVPGKGEPVKDYGKECIIIRKRSLLPPPREKDLENKIKSFWDEECVRSIEKNGKKPFNGIKVKLISYKKKRDTLEFNLGITDWKEFLGTNIMAAENPNYKKSIIEKGLEKTGDAYSFFSNVLAVNSAIETSDNLILVGLRNSEVRMYPRCWHVIGGTVEPDKNKKIDLFENMGREIQEELKIGEKNIKSIYAMGLSRNKHMCHPEISFRTTINLTLKEIQTRLKRNIKEHAYISGVSIDELPSFIRGNQEKFMLPKEMGQKYAAEKLKPFKKVQGATNYFVPSGEVTLILYLAKKGINVEKELPYLKNNFLT